MTPRERFLTLLKNDILKLDLAELNFGIYRILNARRDLVLKFLDQELPELIERQLASLPGTAAEDEEARIYAALDTFFHRYWDDGDFILRPRRGRDAAYSVPYDGSDVYFHWATKGSHYVKSGEFLKAYAFKPEGAGGEVRFEVIAAQQEKDNVKGAKRFFVPASKAQDGAALVLQFEFRPLTEAEAKKYDVKGSTAKVKGNGNGAENGNGNGEDNGGGQLAPSKVQDRLLRAWLEGSDFKSAAVPAALRGAAFEKHVSRYVRKQTSDFFVHPQLGPFLEGELDYFLKNEFLQLWDRATPEALARERAKFNIIRDIGKRIIAFLHQIEDFQARLFEKRKFILKTDWLVMASALAAREGGKALVDKAASDKHQVAEWRRWVGDDSLSGKKLLEKYPHLPIHTVHFDVGYTIAMLGCFEDIDAELGGVLVHGENYAALRTIEAEYKERVLCTYIDPPYNTVASEILYKNEFKQSSWLTLVQPRALAGLRLLTKAGALIIAIDDFELVNLCESLDVDLSTSHERDLVIVNHHPQGAGGTNVSRTHEYAVVISPNKQATLKLPLKGSGKNERPFMRSGTGQNNFRQWRSNSFYAILVDSKTKKVMGVEPPPAKEEKKYPTGKTSAGLERIYPLGANGSERVWRKSYGSGKKAAEQGKLISSEKFVIYEEIDNSGKRGPIGSNWVDKRYNAGTHGSNLLADLFGSTGSFSYPKSLLTVQDFVDAATYDDDTALILDFFGGSGTTAHAVISLNRIDGGQRQFIMVEQGEYFDSVLLPRTAKVICSPEWEQGKPKLSVAHGPEDEDHWSNRTLPLVKVQRIEHYEDTLDALETRDEYDARRAGIQEMAGSDYTLRYLLEEETRGSALFAPNRLFEAPFSAQLPVHTPSGVKLVPIDLAESTLAMLGLRLTRVFEETFEKRRYRIMAARTRTDELHLVVLRDLSPAPKQDFWKREYQWLVKTVEQRWKTKLPAYARIWYNGDTLLLGGETGSSIDAEFARVMQERDPHAATT